MLSENHICAKGLFKVSDQCFLTEESMERFTDMVSDSTLELTCKKLPIAKFGCCTKKNIHNYLKGY